MLISYPMHNVDNAVIEDTRYIGQFGLLHRINNRFCDFAVIGNFPEIELITPLSLDSLSFRAKYSTIEDIGNVYYGKKYYEYNQFYGMHNALLGSYIKDAGQRMFNFVAKKNEGVLDEYGRTYQEAYTAEQVQCVQDYIDKHCNIVRTSINRGLRKDGLKGIKNPNQKNTNLSESGEDE